ncbi:MAG: ATP-dependent protease [Alphaproteobacteria bacterium CG_4_10_14_0_2_um_filter_63_37]|nr:MAG: hypothetical protein AUJ55_09465 [Proteobacteria bacterium CG1_02_64_396]PJA23696.1 MAG: ATP-dependent protease [Alphaproteobacteria bacterium CG_4_10_14_0_2_um_filter_63_37]
MPLILLEPYQLRQTIDPTALGFTSTGQLNPRIEDWIGQPRAEQAARFGLNLDAPGYNLFVLGSEGSGRSSLLCRAMEQTAATRPVPPDLCFLPNFANPQAPHALRLDPGAASRLKGGLTAGLSALRIAIERALRHPDYRDQSEALRGVLEATQGEAFEQLTQLARSLGFGVHQEEGKIVFTTAEGEERSPPPPGEEGTLRRATRAYFDKIAPLESRLNADLERLKTEVCTPVVAAMIAALPRSTIGGADLERWLALMQADLLGRLDLLEEPVEAGEPDLLAPLYGVNVAVDNGDLNHAPVVIDDDPSYRSLFGGIEYEPRPEGLVADWRQIQAGSLLQAHGGFVMLHLRDLLRDPAVWEKLQRVLRSGRLSIEEPSALSSPLPVVGLKPEPVAVAVKIVLIGSRDAYYDLLELDPEFLRHFRAKVDFADELPSTIATWQACARFVAGVCVRAAMPHADAPAVALMLEEMIRASEDQHKISARFADLEGLAIESGAWCRARKGNLITRADVEGALAGRRQRHGDSEEHSRQSVLEGVHLVATEGRMVGMVNGLAEIDIGDARFGHPMRITARVHPGDDGVINIEREVELSGPIHDKGMLILQGYLGATLIAEAPFCLNATLVMEQEYGGVEGDSASVAELVALVSALSGVAVRQEVAVTGALDQYGQVLPVGGVNEKIEGFFRICQARGLSGDQGVLIPAANLRHLMLDLEVVAAVAAGDFHIHAMERVEEGIELLTGIAAGHGGEGEADEETIFGRALKTLRTFRRACHHDKERRGDAREWGRPRR